MKIGEPVTILDTEVVYNGFGITFNGIEFIRLSGNPTEDEARVLLIGYRAGYEAGKNAGRSILQNDFRNLMGLQR